MSLNISLIRASFEEVKPIANDVVTFFYQTLFEQYPASKAFFEKTDMEKQKKALIGSLVTIVDNLDNSDTLVPYLKKMGARHIKYGTQEEHYPMVGKSLLYTLEHFFADNWTPELEEQWSTAIGIIADYMIEGARELELLQQPGELSSMARQLARNVLYKVLEQEVEGEFMKQARKKASNILTQALREEAEMVQEQFSAKKKAS